MRLLFFNRSFHPDVEATGQLLAELCEDLSQEHEVTVVAGRAYNMPRFGSWLPVKREQWGRVRILRAYNPRLNKRRFAGRVVNLLSYFGFSFVAGFFAQRPDVVVVETDPPVLGLVALFFARLYRAQFVFYVQDVFPDVGVALGKLRNPLLIRLLDAVTRLTLRAADRVVVLGPDMQRRLAMKNSRSADRMHVIPNWMDTRHVRPVPEAATFRWEHGLDGKFVVMFSGNLGLSQGLERIIEVAAGLADHPNICFVLVGEGAAKTTLMARAYELNLANVIFLPYQPKETLAVSLSAADVHLATLQRGLAGLIVPSKVYGIMAAGRPFIAAIEEGSHAAEIIRAHRCGVRVEPDSVTELKAAVLWAAGNREELQAMGERGREAAVRLFDRQVAVRKFQEMLGKLANQELPVGAPLPQAKLNA